MKIATHLPTLREFLNKKLPGWDEGFDKVTWISHKTYIEIPYIVFIKKWTMRRPKYTTIVFLRRDDDFNENQIRHLTIKNKELFETVLKPLLEDYEKLIGKEVFIMHEKAEF